MSLTCLYDHIIASAQDTCALLYNCEQNVSSQMINLLHAPWTERRCQNEYSIAQALILCNMTALAKNLSHAVVYNVVSKL